MYKGPISLATVVAKGLDGLLDRQLSKWIYIYTKLGDGSVNDMVTRFLNELQCIIDELVPSYLSNGSGYPIWFFKPLIKIINEKAKYHKLWKRFGNRLDYDAFCLLRQRHKKTQIECWKRYIDSCEDALLSDPKHFWSYTGSLRKDRGVPVQVSSGDSVISGGPEICDAFLDYFFSVYNISQYNHQYNCDDENSNLINAINSIDITQQLVEKYLKNLSRNKEAMASPRSSLKSVQWSLRTLFLLFSSSQLKMGFFLTN